MRLGDLDALKEALTNTQTSLKYMGVFTVDDIKEFIENAPTVEPFQPMCNAKDEAICEEMTTDGHCNCWTPCPNKEERPQGDCENCDFRKFSEKFVDTFVDLMTKNDIASVEQLSEILKGGTE